MSIGNVSQVMARINSAKPDSPIAVFKTDKAGELNGVFASTVITQRMIEERHPDLVGVFDMTCSAKDVEKLLSLVVKA